MLLCHGVASSTPRGVDESGGATSTERTDRSCIRLYGALRRRTPPRSGAPSSGALSRPLPSAAKGLSSRPLPQPHRAHARRTSAPSATAGDSSRLRGSTPDGSGRPRGAKLMSPARRDPPTLPVSQTCGRRQSQAVRRRVPSRRRDAARGARPTATREARGAAARPARRRPSPARSPSPSCPSCSTDRRTRRRSARRPSGSSGRRSAPSRGAGRPTTPGRGRSARAARWSRSDRP